MPHFSIAGFLGSPLQNQLCYIQFVNAQNEISCLDLVDAEDTWAAWGDRGSLPRCQSPAAESRPEAVPEGRDLCEVGGPGLLEDHQVPHTQQTPQHILRACHSQSP